MRKLCVTILATTLCVASTVKGAGRACDKWDIFTDFAFFEGAVRQTEKGFAADENGIRVETEEKIGAAGVTHRRTVVRNMAKKTVYGVLIPLAALASGGADVTPESISIALKLDDADGEGRDLWIGMEDAVQLAFPAIEGDIEEDGK